MVHYCAKCGKKMETHEGNLLCPAYCPGCHEKIKKEIQEKGILPTGGRPYTNEELFQVGGKVFIDGRTQSGKRIVRKSEPMGG